MKYLELIKGQFTADHEARAKQQEPYVAYSEEAGGVMYTFIPEPAVGPADNEIWYISNDGNVVTPSGSFGVSIVSNEYNNGKGVITFDGPVTSIVDGAFYWRSSLTSVTIPNSVTSIGQNAFYYCPSLTSVTIPNSVTSIGDNAFLRCPSLTSVAIPNSVTSIGWGTFEMCSSLTYVTIPNSVTSIGNQAFSYCSSLTYVTIPNSVTSIGDSAFFDCSALTSITFEGTIEQWNSITKVEGWNTGVPATYVQCSDGQVEL